MRLLDDGKSIVGTAMRVEAKSNHEARWRPGEPGIVPFGVDQEAPEDGFRVCRDCGIVVTPGTSLDDIRHRRSCSRRRANDKRRQESRNELPYNWEPVYLYR